MPRMPGSARRAHRVGLNSLAVLFFASLASIVAPSFGQGSDPQTLAPDDTTFATHTRTSRQDGTCSYSVRPSAAEAIGKDPLRPRVFNASVRARGSDIVFFQGTNLTPTARIMLDLPDLAPQELTIVNRVAPGWIAARIPSNISQAFSLRVINEHGSSNAISINGAIPYHLDTTQIAPGQHFRLFGRNLIFGNCKPTVFVGGHPAEVNTTASHDFMLDLQAPSDIAPGAGVDVSVDNGGGLGATRLEGGVKVVDGLGDPLHLKVGWAASFDFATRVITAPAMCDGKTDDTEVIKRTIFSAAEKGGATVLLPAGTCRIAATIDLESRIVLKGAGRDKTILRYERDYPLYADSKDLVGLEDLQLLNAGSTQEGMVWRSNSRSFVRNVTINMLVSRQWFLTDNRDFLFDGNLVVQTGSYDQQNPYRFDRSVGLLFSNNRSINVNGSPTFQDVRDSAFLNNRFTRDAISQNETPVVAHHGFVMDFARRISVIGNTFDVVNGPITNKERNDGEAILVEGGGPNRTESTGLVKSALTASLTDPDNSIMAKLAGGGRQHNLDVAIVSGNAAGQTRHIVDYDGTTMTLDRPWDVVPEAGSHYSTFVWSLDKVLIIGNTLSDNPRGIWLYQSSIRDVTIENNTIRDGGGVYLRSYQNLNSKLFNVQSNIDIADNTVVNRTGSWMSHIIMVCVSADDETFGVGQLGIDVRRNIVVANRTNVTSTMEEYAADEGFSAIVRVERQQPKLDFSPRSLGPIFQNNICTNCERPYAVSAGVAGAIFSGIARDGTVKPNVIRDVDLLGHPGRGSSKTVILP